MANVLSSFSGSTFPATEKSKGNSTVSLNTNEFMFYCNNPEEVGYSALADSGKWLYRDSVSGNGQIYTWHQNKSGGTIQACILVYNPNSYSVKINITNCGTTNGAWQDCAAWESYYNGSSKSYTIAAGQYKNIFQIEVSNGNPWGIVARVNIVKASAASTPASVMLYDIAYQNATKSGNATDFAAIDGTSRVRGVGHGYYTYLNFASVSLSSTAKYYSICANNDTFEGEDMAYVTDVSEQASGKILGGYGQQFNVTLPVSGSGNFRIFLGVIEGAATGEDRALYYPFVNLGSTVKYSTSEYGLNTYIDVIEGTAGETVSFSMVVPACSSTRCVIGVRKVN